MKHLPDGTRWETVEQLGQHPVHQTGHFGVDVFLEEKDRCFVDDLAEGDKEFVLELDFVCDGAQELYFTVEKVCDLLVPCVESGLLCLLRLDKGDKVGVGIGRRDVTDPLFHHARQRVCRRWS